MTTGVITGFKSGNVMARKRWKGLAPSISAAS
jgi:hypothetical protein